MELEKQSSIQAKKRPAQQGAQSHLFPPQLFPNPATFLDGGVGFRGVRGSDKLWERCSRDSSGPHCEPLSDIWYSWMITSA